MSCRYRNCCVCCHMIAFVWKEEFAVKFEDGVKTLKDIVRTVITVIEIFE